MNGYAVQTPPNQTLKATGSDASPPAESSAEPEASALTRTIVTADSLCAVTQKDSADDWVTEVANWAGITSGTSESAARVSHVKTATCAGDDGSGETGPLFTVRNPMSRRSALKQIS
eukprot:Amastigsp_a5493_25.p4 type:complete len:117 gc:universal Amastigsp_a5493_25:612-262(-)